MNSLPSDREIIHIPKAFMKPSEPRAESVCCAFRAEFGHCEHNAHQETPESIAESIAACEQERDRENLVPFPARPVLNLRSDLPGDVCIGCGEFVAHHWDTSGCLWIGCEGAPGRRRVSGLVSRPLTFAEQYSNPYPEVADAIDAALSSACGVTVTTFYQGLTSSERLNLSRRLAEIAIRAREAK